MLLCLLLGGFVASGRLKPAMAKPLYMILVFCIMMWTLGIAVFLNASSAPIGYLGATIFYVSALLFPPTLLLFAATYPLRFSRVVNFLLWIVTITATLGVGWYSLVRGYIVALSDPIDLQSVMINQAEYLVFAIFFTLTFLAAITLSIVRIIRSPDYMRSQIMYYLSGITITSIPGFYANLFLPYLGDYRLIWIGPMAALIFIGLTAYAIVRHKFFDIKYATIRSVTYVLALSTMAIIYFGLAYAASVVFSGSTERAGVSTSPINMILAVFLAFLFQPIKIFFDSLTNRIFFRASYDPEVFTARLGKILTSTVELDALLEKAAKEIADTLKASHATFVVYDNQRLDTVKSHGVFRKLPDHMYEQLSKHVHTSDEAIISVEDMVRETYSHTELGKLYRALSRKNVLLILPLHGEFGYLLLGEQKAGGYSQRDLRVLDSLISELSIAIQNALSIQELRELNVTLQQRIDDATHELRHTNQKLRQLDTTKDEFISMASHQLRTPLTSIKGYLSMVLEGDVGDITQQQRTMLTEAFTSSERMVHLIGDFLNVSRLQTGKFMIDRKSCDVAALVADEVNTMKRLATSHGMTLEFRKPSVSPVLFVDEDKLRQVIMNFIDNAIYYSPEQSTVTVKMQKRDGNLCLEVHDEGMGVPEDVQERLFTKFFRADNARKQRPDGTGIGLYLAKKVIVAHGGDIIFKTRAGKGSVFVFCLPIAKLSKKPDLKD